MKHEQLDDATREQAALYALGCLTEPEAEDYGAHLTECLRCREAVTSLGNTVGLVPFAPQAVPPPADLKKRLFDRLFGHKAVLVPAAKCSRPPGKDDDPAGHDTLGLEGPVEQQR